MPSHTYFFTGFPGFIATRLVEKLFDQDPSSRFLLLVHPSQQEKAEKVISQLTQKKAGSRGCFIPIPGDITKENLDIPQQRMERLREEIDYVFHLAAIYDLAVSKETAYKVNVTGTRNVNDFVLSLSGLKRYVYFSTAYVSGKRTGRILETELDEGQSFKNHYEASKFEAEVITQKIMKQVPLTIIRPGIVMGDSKTGETVKFDGPYFVMRYLDKFSRFPIPYPGRGKALLNLVPVDYIVDATCYLATHPVGEGKVYHLTDPNPYPAREAFGIICETLVGKKASFTLPSFIVYGLLSIPAFRRWLMVEKETIEYFRLKAEYDCSQALEDLKDSGVKCADFKDYIQVCVKFYENHRHDPDKMIEVR
ncbi:MULTISPECIES: SDR family oxidoreductase [Thermoactinomyces]|jgi:thioester reductase-like protein|uniref:SDR family oxidoreductase n=1 Tax=Thermoactinomyces vulgaris TaxID=2026 RepID=A0ABS0QDE5_THEVU|nr:MULTISPECIES: SDR family oxidoreductase [Thermoactinomyces]KFZ40453.1 3-beta hydroxysteroid dehydrogenase [Thermoactinomyces sp. Gus2-1]KYQ87923.1 3-beta hydroxysteroid dehydrogenase [Thermoactinomyces sp. AS95]MBA4550508.1 SDR family oxidoreductase [Thermoactinomyces vulgaris]MBA4595919.1 SDR family oxidoreductase [Thermoactinomyces vulgaris]MBH8582392.1 SDR family oxidoreductase [Thermoactinomyces sp. CICC 10735]